MHGASRSSPPSQPERPHGGRAQVLLRRRFPWQAVAGPPAATRRARRAVLAAAYVLLFVSCESPFAPDESQVDTIQTNPLAVTLAVGETRAVTVRVVDDAGATLSNRRLFWSSQNPAIATVSQEGIVTGVAAGATQVAVSAGGKSAVVPVTVNARPVSLVRVTPATASVIAGRTRQLTAEALDAGGERVTGRPVQWATGDATVATVTSTGLVSGVAAGTTNITASIDGVLGSAVVTVQPVPVASLTLTPDTDNLVVGRQLQLTATPRDSAGAPLAGRTIAWTSNAPTIASVSSTGVVTGLATGTATITATSEGRSATARITVSLVPIDTLSVTPRTATVAAGQAVQLSARAVDATGALLTGRPIAWETDQPAIATVSASGLVSALTAGRAIITASAEGRSATATITVSPVPVASVSILPPAATILLGNTQQFTATTRDASNNLLPGRSITWISGAPSVATVTQAGLVTAVGAGSALIFAASEGVSTSVTVTVTTVGVAQVRMTPTAGTVQQGRTLQLSAQPVDAAGTPITGRTVSWNSSAPTVASVSSTGLVTGIVPGSANVTATVDGVIGTSAITVTPVPVANATVVPQAPTLTVGGTLQLTALLTDASGAPLSPVGRTIGWSIVAPAIATVSPTGLLTAVSPGTTTVQATVEGVIAQSTVTVTGVPIASIVVSPDPATIEEFRTRQFTATVRDAQGALITGRTLVWQSTNNAIATVSQTGLVTANVPGIARIIASAPNQGAGGSTPADTASIAVTFAPVASATITPNPLSVTAGLTTQPTVALRSSTNQPLSTTGRTVTWSISMSPAGSATINSATGLVTGVAFGSGTVTVTANSPGQATPVIATAPIAVSTVQIARVAFDPFVGTLRIGPAYARTVSAQAFDAGNNALSGRLIAWASLDTGITVSTSSSTNGQVTLTGRFVPASVRITATAQGASGAVADTITINTDFVPIASGSTVTLATGQADSVVAATGQSRSYTATPRDSAGNILVAGALGGRVPTWSVTPGLASLTATGASAVVTPIVGATGTATVTADYTTAAPSSALKVLVPARTVLLQVSSDSLLVGQSATVAATVVDAANAAIPGRTVRVTSGNAAIAAIAAPTGTPTLNTTVTGASAPNGRNAVTLVATSIFDSLSASSAFTPVSTTTTVLAPVSNIIVSTPPGTDSILINGTVQATATVRDASGNTLVGRSITWSTGDAMIATVAQTGVVTGVGAGVTAIRASELVSGVVGTKSLIVQQPVNSVAITTPDSSVFVGESQPITVALRDINNQPLTGRAVTFASSAPGVVSISAAGVISAVGAGTTNITASSEGRTSPPLPFTVSLVPVSSVSVSATPTPNVYPTHSFPATVVARDAANNVLSLAQRTIVWTSGNTAIATVSAIGSSPGSATITAVATGTVTITASVDGIAAGTPITIVVRPVPVTSISVTPSPGSMFKDDTTVVFTATPRDSAGNALSPKPLTWSSTFNANKARIVDATTGLIAALDSGTATITVTASGAGVGGSSPAQNVTLNIGLRPIGTVAVTPSTVTLPATTGTATLTVDVLSAAPNPRPLPARACQAVSSNAGQLTVSPGNSLTDAAGKVSLTVTGVAPAANVVVTVTCDPGTGGARSGTATVTVP